MNIFHRTICMQNFSLRTVPIIVQKPPYLLVHSDIMAALNCKKDVVLILLDLSAAFDTIDHDILFHHLENRFGVSGLALQWFKSYLSNRTYSVSLKSLPSSKSVTVSFGVPQGSVLGPILFTL